jgi:hypothetical protein
MPQAAHVTLLCQRPDQLPNGVLVSRVGPTTQGTIVPTRQLIRS